MDVISEFISRYRREFDFYDQAARLAAQRLQSLVESAGIRAIVTARAKNPSRLEAKSRQRAKNNAYGSVEEIYNDIVDLAGSRLALYFPGDRLEVDKLIRANFDLMQEPREFPLAKAPTHKKRFSGYWATHYRVRIPESGLPEPQRRYSEARVEIQVASVLMHAWSEVEHDLVYKPAEGTLSDEEYAILDELNGLVMAGEIALERLQHAIETRVAEKDRRFGNHFDLTGYLLDLGRPIFQGSPDAAALGRIDLLYALLERLGLDTPGKMRPFVTDLHPDTERRPIAEQIIDKIIGNNSSRYKLYSEIRALSERPDRVLAGVGGHAELESAMGQFLHNWIKFEKAVRALSTLESPRGVPLTVLIRNAVEKDSSLMYELDRIRNLRNNLVHGVQTIDPETLKAAGERLTEITKSLGKPNPRRKKPS